MNSQKRKIQHLDRRHRRVRRSVRGVPERPRLSVYRSLAHIYAQVIDDTTGRTLVSASTAMPEFRAQGGRGGNVKAAEAVGVKVAELAKAKGIEKVCFDRGGRKYHGRIKALAEAARKAGLKL
jgi:large subunit ribosomal protein L18